MTPQDRQRVLFNAGIAEEVVRGRESLALMSGGGHKHVFHVAGRPVADVQGAFTADELEAIASWMREHAGA